MEEEEVESTYHAIAHAMHCLTQDLEVAKMDFHLDGRIYRSKWTCNGGYDLQVLNSPSDK